MSQCNVCKQEKTTLVKFDKKTIPKKNIYQTIEVCENDKCVMKININLLTNWIKNYD